MLRLVTKAGLIEKAFRQFDMFLREHGFSARKGQIVDDRHHLQNLRKKFQNIRLDAGIQDAAAIFWYPYNMVFRPIHTVS